MGLSDAIGTFYSGIEEQYYALMDSLEEKGLPVYKLIDPLEERGIPAFPATIALILIVLALVFGFFFVGGSPEIALNLSIEDQFESSISGVSIEVKRADGSNLELSKSKYGDGDTIDIGPQGIGSELEVLASKEGYVGSSTMVLIGTEKKEIRAILKLEKILTPINAKIRLVDDTGTLIKDAKVVLLSDDDEITCTDSNKDGVFECIGISEDVGVILKVESTNYETISGRQLSFSEGDVETVSLVAKPDANEGKSNLLIRVHDKATDELVENISLQIFNGIDDALITNRDLEEGEFAESLDKGTLVRVVVSSEGYITYDSSVEGKNITLRNDEEIMDIKLLLGGTNLRVAIIDADNLSPVPDADVQLFNVNSELLNYQKTGFGGTIYLNDLNSEATYYITAYSGRHLPTRLEIIPLQQTDVEIKLVTRTASNSAALNIEVRNSGDELQNNSTLNFYEMVAGKELPLGIKQEKTDVFGRYIAQLAVGKTVKVKAYHEREGGESEKIIAPLSNDMTINMETIEGMVTLMLTDSGGNPITGGELLIESPSGEILYDADVIDGEIYFDPKGKDYVVVTYTAPDGSEYVEEINVEGKNLIEMVLGGAKTLLAPEINFLGVFDASGKEVGGVVKGEDYYLKFETIWPDGTYNAGVHVRVGDDFVKYADTDDVGVLGFSAQGARYFYGRSYSPLPEPGFEGIDFQNMGSAGEFNKWVELYFDSGNGTRIVKIRVQAKATANASEFDVHYRAWAKIGGETYRSPEDNVLGGAIYTDTRTSLYAETNTETLKIFDESTRCNNEICANYKFVRQDGTEYLPEEFKAAINELYALEIELNPSENTNATIKASTSQTNPKIAFTGYGIDSFGEFPDNDKLDTSVEANDISVLANRPLRARLFFKTQKVESSSISLQIITEKTVVEENFHFNIHLERDMEISIYPEFVSTGENFTVNLKSEDSSPITDAEIKITGESGEHLLTIVGNGTNKNGSGGNYEISNTFGAGKINLEITASGFRPVKKTIEIGMEGILSLPPKIEIDLEKIAGGANDSAKEISVEIENASNDLVQDLSYEIVNDGGFPGGMEITASGSTSVNKGSDSDVRVKASYNGDGEREYGEAELVVSGTVSGKYLARATSRVVVRYNPELEDSCIELSKEKLVVYIVGEENSSVEETLTIKNNCNLRVSLIPEIVEKRGDEKILIELNEVSLEPSGSKSGGRNTDEAEVNVAITNLLARNYPQKKKYTYEIYFNSDAITKSLPVEVYVWNKSFALQVNRNIELWLTETDSGKPPVSQVPLFVQNIGEADIENLTFSISAQHSRGSVDVRVLPPIDVPVLKKGATLFPTKWIVATAIRTEKTTLADVSQIEVKGSINGQQYDFGPIFITSHVSAPECLKASTNYVQFEAPTSKAGSLSYPIKLRNTCAEELRIRGIDPFMFGSNKIYIDKPDISLFPGEEVEMLLILDKREDWQTTAPVRFKAFGSISQVWIDSTPINVDIKLGVFSTEKGASTEAVTMKVCGTETNDNKKGEEKLVKFPRIATQANCDVAYCDAELLAQFLADRIESKVRDAKRQISNYKEEVINSSCSPYETFCSFDGLGVRSEIFYVYFQNDSLSTEMLRSALTTKDELKSFRVDTIIPGTDSGLLIGGIGNQLFLNDSFRGCGRYSVRITGAANVTGNHIDSDHISVLLDLHSSEAEGGAIREMTEQCDNKIQNVMNFLPVDKSYTKADPKESWLSTVETEDSELDALGEEVAKELFGSKDRLATLSAGNILELRLGTEPGYITKIEMEKFGDVARRRVYANIKESVGGGGELQAEIAKEAAKAIGQLSGNEIDGCISPDEDYFLIKSAKEIGKLNIESCEAGKLGILPEAVNCCDFNIVDEVPEIVNVDIRLKEERQGIEEPYITDDKGNKISGDIELEFEKDGRYSEQFQLCAVGSKQDFQNSRGKKIVITAESATDKAKKAQEKEVELQICGIHPKNLLEKISAAKEGEHYFTPVWKGTPDEISLNSIRLMGEAKKNSAEAAKIRTSGDSISGSFMDLMKKPEVKAMTFGYLPVCGLTTFALSGIKSLGVSFWPEFFMTCGLPYFWAIADELPVARDFKQILLNSWDTILGFFQGEQKTIAERAQDTSAAGSELDGEFWDIVDGAIVGVGSRTGWRSVSAGWDSAETFSNAKVAKSLSDKISDGIMDEYVNKRGSLSGISGDTAARSKLESTLRTKMKESLEKEFKAIDFAKEGSNEQVRLAVQKTMGEFGSDKALAEAILDAKTKGVLNSNGEELLKKSSREIVKEKVKPADIAEELGSIYKIGDKVGPAPADPTEANFNTFKNNTMNDLKKASGDLKPMKDAISDKILESLDTPDLVDKAKLNQKISRVVNNITQQDLKVDWEIFDQTGKRIKGVRVDGLNWPTPNNPIFNEIEILWQDPDMKVKYTATLSDDSTKKIIRESVAAVNRDLHEELAKGIKTGVSKGFASEASEDIAEKVLEKSKNIKTERGFFRKLLKTPFTKEFWKNLGKGAFTGAVANGAGLFAYDQLMKYYESGTDTAKIETFLTGTGGDDRDNDNDGKVDEEICDGIDNDGDSHVDEDCYDVESDQLFEKYKTYLVEIKADAGQKTYEIEEVTMDKVPSGASWLQTCNDKSLDEAAENFLCTLTPDPNHGLFKAGDAKYIELYYKSYCGVMAGAQNDYGVPEALLVTVGIWKSEMGTKGKDHMLGCDVGNPKSKSPEENIRCAAEELEKIIPTCTGIDEKEKIKCVLEKYNDAPNNLKSSTADYAVLVETYCAWQKFNTAGLQAC
ncbi:MAG: hypothetical protein ABID38_04680 [Candidatus Diapherotrites archaeon]